MGDDSMSKKGLVAIIVILTIAVLGLGTYVGYDKFIKPNSTKEVKKDEGKKKDTNSSSYDSSKPLVADNEDYKSVLFEIKYNSNIENKSNAEIEHLSLYPDEQEVLFFPFSSFIIENISIEKKIYIISLNYLGIYQKNFLHF